MTALVGYLLIFVAVGAAFLFAGMVTGRLLRPARPGAEKETTYECGEPTIGSPWVQFDLRFYVVALLFVIFDVEMAFFFPWGTVFGSAKALSGEDVTPEQRAALVATLGGSAEAVTPPAGEEVEEQRAAARRLMWLAFADILIFFGVLIVGFAYLWKRGDLDWVRSVAAQQAAGPRPPPTA